MNEEITIEKNVPIPENKQTGFTKALHKLKVGDSFVVPHWVANSCTLANHIGIKIMTRKCPEGGYRIWRKT